MVCREIPQHFGHSRCYPAISPSPEEWHIGGMIKEPVRLLQLIEIGDHFLRVPVQILLVSCCPIRFQLKDSQHIHVVNPISGFRRKTVRLRVFPLTVGILLAVVEILLVLGLHTNFQGDDTENFVIHVSAWADHIGLGSAWKQWIEAFDEFVSQSGIRSQLCESQRPIPGADFSVEDGRMLMRTGNEVFCKSLPNLLRRSSSRPIVEVVLLCVRNGGPSEQQQCNRLKLHSRTHRVWLLILFLVPNTTFAENCAGTSAWSAKVVLQTGAIFAHRILSSMLLRFVSAAARLHPMRRSLTPCNAKAPSVPRGAVTAKKSARLTSFK